MWVPYSDHPVCLSVSLSVCLSVSPSVFSFSSITSVFLIRSLSNFTKYTIMACFNYSIITISFRAYLISILYSDWLFTLSAITLSFFTRFSSDFHLTCIHFFFLFMGHFHFHFWWWDVLETIFSDFSELLIGLCMHSCRTRHANLTSQITDLGQVSWVCKMAITINCHFMGPFLTWSEF